MNAEAPSAAQLLEQLGSYPEDHLFLVKDFHPYLTDPSDPSSDAGFVAGLGSPSERRC